MGWLKFHPKCRQRVLWWCPKMERRFGALIIWAVAWLSALSLPLKAQATDVTRGAFILQVGDGTLILSLGPPIPNPIQPYMPFPSSQSFSFITPPPSMEYIIFPTRPSHRPPTGYTMPPMEYAVPPLGYTPPPFGYQLWQRPTIIFYPYWHWGYPTHLWDCKPWLWLILTRPPVILIFKLSKAKADDVAQRLRETQIHPMLRFMASGDKLIVAGPREVLTGVGQARVKELIKALDESSQTSKRESINQTAQRQKIIVETYLATVEGSPPDSSLPQDVVQAANALGLKSVCTIRTDECDVSLGQTTTLKWEAPRRSTLRDLRLAGDLCIQPIAADENGALMSISLNATIGLPLRSSWTRHTANASIICDEGKPAILVSNNPASRSSLILRFRH